MGWINSLTYYEKSPVGGFSWYMGKVVPYMVVWTETANTSIMKLLKGMVGDR